MIEFFLPNSWPLFFRRLNCRCTCYGVATSSLLILAQGTPCLADDQDQVCAGALANSARLIRSMSGSDGHALELGPIQNWETTNYHPGSEQLTLILGSARKRSALPDRQTTDQRHLDRLKTNLVIQAQLARAIVKACPSIEIVRYQFAPQVSSDPIVSTTSKLNGQTFVGVDPMLIVKGSSSRLSHDCPKNCSEHVFSRDQL